MIERVSREIKKLWSMLVTCPSCGEEKLRIEESLHDLPLVGKVVLSSGSCQACGYKHSDVRMLESQGPQRLKFKVRRPKDLGVIVVRAPSATVTIPELGVEIKPGPAAQGFITTIEGVLRRVADVLDIVCRDEDDAKECYRRKREVERAINGKVQFTLVIDDPEGLSRVISDETEREELCSKQRGGSDGD